jgi:uncharacterized damage-inducible protein DinB
MLARAFGRSARRCGCVERRTTIAGVSDGWPERCLEHRREIESFLAALETLDDELWAREPAPGKWSPGQITEHLVLSYAAMRRELAGGVGLRLRSTFWRRFLIRWRFLPMVLKQGRLPRGAPAVREIRPDAEPRPRSVAAPDLREQAKRFEEELTQARDRGEGRLTHPFFGRLSPPEALRFVAVHAAHHRGQLPQAQSREGRG